MKDLADVLQRQAATARPTPNLANVRERAARHRRRSRRTRAALTAGAALVAVLALLATTSVRARIKGDQGGTVAPPAEIEPTSLGGLVFEGTTDASYGSLTLQRSDPNARDGSYSVVVRRAGGTIAKGTAVVTYPDTTKDDRADNALVPPSSADLAVTKTVVQRPEGSLLIRSTGLSADDIAAIAAAARVANGRPVVALRSAASDLVVEAAGPTRPPAIHEARYGCDALGEDTELGSLCYTGVTTSPGFENALYVGNARPGPVVNGHPTVASAVGGGNATLAWEARPGVIAYIGYSGSGLGDEQIAALARLAERAKALSPGAWAATRPQTVEQNNQW